MRTSSRLLEGGSNFREIGKKLTLKAELSRANPCHRLPGVEENKMDLGYRR